MLWCCGRQKSRTRHRDSSEEQWNDFSKTTTENKSHLKGNSHLVCTACYQLLKDRGFSANTLPKKHADSHRISDKQRRVDFRPQRMSEEPKRFSDGSQWISNDPRALSDGSHRMSRRSVSRFPSRSNVEHQRQTNQIHSELDPEIDHERFTDGKTHQTPQPFRQSFQNHTVFDHETRTKRYRIEAFVNEL
jgi:hypothetical protein